MPIVKLRDDELIDHGGVMKLIDRHQVIRFAEEYSHLEKGDIVHFWSTKKLLYAKRPLLDKYFGKGTILSNRVAKWKDIKADDRIARRERFENSAEMRKSFEKRYGKKLHGHSDMRILSWFDLEIGYCDCCDKKAIITWHTETFNGDGLKACEDCGRKVLYVLRERSTWCLKRTVVTVFSSTSMSATSTLVGAHPGSIDRSQSVNHTILKK